MKKFFFHSLAVLMAYLMLWSALPLQAHAAGISFSGSGSLRAGNTVTVTFSVSGSNILAVEATLNYDSSTLELQGTKRLIGGSWDMQQNGSKIILRDTALSSPINSSTSIFSATFKVKSGVSSGTTVSASVSNVSVSDGNSDTSLGSATWSANILPPLSGDANLKDLWCDNAELNFTGGTEYSITVPYEISSLDLDWTRSHSGADVSISGNSLSVGSNTVTVTVEAENGNTKRYYIYVTRQQDPNYVPSTDAALSSLSLSTGTLSPAFSPDVTDYVVYLPYEVTGLTVSATANDSKAKGVSQVRKILLPIELPPAEDAPTAGQTQEDPLPTEPQYEVLADDASLPEGETLYVVTCTAEDGTTTRDYTLHVIRMPVYAGVLPEIIPPITEPVEPEPEPEPTTYDISLPLVMTLPYVGEVTLQQAALGVLIALGVLLLLLLLVVWLLGRRRGRKKALRQMAKRAASSPVEEVPVEVLSVPTEESPVENAEAPTEEPIVEAAESSAEEATTETEDIPVEEPIVEAEEAPAEEPVAEAEEAPAEEPVAEAEEAPAEEPATEAEAVPAENPPVEVEEVPTESSQAEVRETPAVEDVDLSAMSLEDLLEDIRNM